MQALRIQTSLSRPGARKSVSIEAKYRGIGTDLSNVSKHQRHANDVGSPEVQIARLSARVTQLSSHLQANKKDNSTKRGLMSVIAQRMKMLTYLERTDRESYVKICQALGLKQKAAAQV